MGTEESSKKKNYTRSREDRSPYNFIYGLFFCTGLILPSSQPCLYCVVSPVHYDYWMKFVVFTLLFNFQFSIFQFPSPAYYLGSYHTQLGYTLQYNASLHVPWFWSFLCKLVSWKSNLKPHVKSCKTATASCSNGSMRSFRRREIGEGEEDLRVGRS